MLRLNLEHDPDNGESFEAAARGPIEQYLRNSFSKESLPSLMSFREWLKTKT